MYEVNLDFIMDTIIAHQKAFSCPCSLVHSDCDTSGVVEVLQTVLFTASFLVSYLCIQDKVWIYFINFHWVDESTFTLLVIGWSILTRPLRKNFKQGLDTRKKLVILKNRNKTFPEPLCIFIIHCAGTRHNLLMEKLRSTTFF